MNDFRRREQEIFGGRLRQLRGEVRSAELAARVGVSQPTISKIENGLLRPSPDLLRRIAEALGLAPDVRDELLADLTRLNTDIAIWQGAGGSGEAKQRVIGSRDRAAQLRRSYHPTVVPGLMQTAEYTRAVFARSRFIDDDDRAHAVAARLERQTVLFAEGHRFEFLIGEAALRARLGPAAMMRAQLDRVASLATLANVRIGLLPLRTELRRIVPNGFSIYDRRRVAVETYTSELALSDERDIDAYSALFTELAATAVYDAAAAALLAEIAESFTNDAEA